MKRIFTTAAATAALTLIAGMGAAGQALAAQTTGAANVAHSRSATSAAAATRTYPGYPMIRTATPAGASTSQRNFYSNNWSGFAMQKRGVTFRAISATFFAPFVNCRFTPNSLSSHWVGFDGVSDKTVEQDGIEADCHGSKPFYRAWWELFPRPETRIKLRIKGGDSVTASVTYRRSTRKFTFYIRNNTTRRHFRLSLRCKKRCRRSSAEVISEAPTLLTKSGPKLARLSDYGATGYTGISVANSHNKRGGVASRHWRTLKIFQVTNHGKLLARPTSLHGPSFSSYWFNVG